MRTLEHLTPEDFENMLNGRAEPHVWAHIQTCAECRLTWEEIQIAHQMLKKAPEITAPAHFLERVMGNIHALSHPLPFRRRVRKLLGITLGLGLYGWLSLWSVIVSYAVVHYLAARPTYVGFRAVLALLNSFGWNWAHVLSVFLRVMTARPWALYTLLSLALSLGISIGVTRYYYRRLFVYIGE